MMSDREWRVMVISLVILSLSTALSSLTQILLALS